MQVTEHSAHFKLFFILLILFFSVSSFAQKIPNQDINALLDKGITDIINQNYSSAEKTFTYLDKTYSDLPLGKVYLAATKIAKAYDYSEPFDAEEIEIILESAKQQSQSLLDLNEDDIWFKYYFALTEGYISYFDALQGNWLEAMSTGLSSVSAFEECLELDPEFSEALIALGTYEYWKSRKTEFLNWLPFVDNDMEEGIQKLKSVINLNSYNSHLALNSLIWIYIDMEDYEMAARYAKMGIDRYPESRYFKWGLARAYENINPYDAIRVYKQILKSYPKTKNGNSVNEITLQHLIAQQYAKIGNQEKAIYYCDRILGQKNIPQYAAVQLKDRIYKVKELKTELTN